MMCLEYAESDLRKMLHESKDEVYGDYSQALMVKLATEIARGMTYIHGKLTTDDKMHLDLKPENVLLARDGDTWTAKVADFGAQVDGEGGDGQSGQDGGSAPRRKVTADPNAISPIGTWECATTAAAVLTFASLPADRACLPQVHGVRVLEAQIRRARLCLRRVLLWHDAVGDAREGASLHRLPWRRRHG